MDVIPPGGTCDRAVSPTTARSGSFPNRGGKHGNSKGVAAGSQLNTAPETAVKRPRTPPRAKAQSKAQHVQLRKGKGSDSQSVSFKEKVKRIKEELFASRAERPRRGDCESLALSFGRGPHSVLRRWVTSTLLKSPHLLHCQKQL